MKIKRSSTRCSMLLAMIVFLAAGCAQAQKHSSTMQPADKSAKVPHYIDGKDLNLSSLLPSPPAVDSAAALTDLATVHKVEEERTPAEIKAAQDDENEVDIFLYANVLGAGFAANDLPLTAKVSKHMRNDVSLLNGPIKARYQRVRPYNADPALHPPCKKDQEFSYPSSHSINGYLYGFTLAEIVPEQHDAILARADEYAHHRVVCEAHFPSDTEAGRRIASIVFGDLLATEKFRQDLDAARAEVRTHLHLPAAAGDSAVTTAH